jgi:hypothetical protein
MQLLRLWELERIGEIEIPIAGKNKQHYRRRNVFEEPRYTRAIKHAERSLHD